MSAVDYPINLRLAERRVLVVGGGVVATGRVAALVEAGAVVTVIAPDVSAELAALVESGAITWRARVFQDGDTAGFGVVFTALDDEDASRAVVHEARGHGALVNAADIPHLCDFTLMSVGRKGPVTVAVSTSGKAPALSRKLKDALMEHVGLRHLQLLRLSGFLRTQYPAGPARMKLITGIVQGEVGALLLRGERRAAFAALRLLLQEAPTTAVTSSSAENGLLPRPRSPGAGPERGGGWGARDHNVPESAAVTSSSAENVPLPRQRLPGSRDPEVKPVGSVALVGAGPGAADLLTVRAARLIACADVIVHDRLVHQSVLALASPHARLLYVGKEGHGESALQDEINQTLITQAQLGRRVVRLKGGDPFVFGRGGEEALALVDAGVPWQVVPGISAGVAAPGIVGIPVTHRNVSGAVTFATASRSDRPVDWANLAGAETLVLFMAGKHLAKHAQSLIDAGRDAATPAAVVEAATWSDERVVVSTLGAIAADAGALGSPALLVVGEVVRLRERLQSVVRPVMQPAVDVGLDVPPPAPARAAEA